ncbi:MAG TPA: glycosyltransferase [Propionicimonas sp.]|uniref:glycosyltransferase n=1 Tax=Propionicimonas sp. TaxID=1955623 RepID=UPI002F3F582B
MRLGFLSTYPPTQCGLATFTRSLATAVDAQPRTSAVVVRSVETPERLELERVVGELVAGDRLSQRRAAELLNGCDVAVIQHEYGIYGGEDGSEVLTVIRALRVPAIVVLHTVLAAPTPGQREVLEAILAAAKAVVTMTFAARDRLLANYRVPAQKVVVIPHGAPAGPKDVAPVPGRVLTWGLLGPGKGLEWGVAAMAHLTDLVPAPQYLVAGEIHPKVLARDGDAYRQQLRRQAEQLGVSDMVTFDSSYRPTEELTRLIATAQVVLLPYDSTEQVTSGVLIEAVAVGRPVVATRFPHAVELLTDGVGITVPHKDPVAIAAALRQVLADPDTERRAVATAKRVGANLLWPAVARRYLQLADQLLAPGRRVAGDSAVES